jgi:hypothetical protein
MITIDKTKAEKIFGRLLDAYRSKEYPFDQPEVTPPQIPENLPRSLAQGTREHALFLFALCYWMRGGIESHAATKQLAKLYDFCPELFLPEAADKIDPGILAVMFQVFGLGFNAREIGMLWIKNLEILAKHWKNDPRNLFADITTYEEACARIQNHGSSGFGGFQEKMVSMITYFYMDAGIIDCWNFPIPVDFHVLRTIFAHEIIVADPSEFNGNGFYTKPILATVRKLFYEYCAEHHADPLRLCDAIWLYSRTMCNQHPGNQSSVGGRHGRKTELWPVARWTSAQTRTYERTCGNCFLSETCQWCVPSAEYYIRGRIILREERDTPPQGSLFPLF